MRLTVANPIPVPGTYRWDQTWQGSKNLLLKDISKPTPLTLTKKVRHLFGLSHRSQWGFRLAEEISRRCTRDAPRRCAHMGVAIRNDTRAMIVLHLTFRFIKLSSREVLVHGAEIDRTGTSMRRVMMRERLSRSS